MITWEQAVQELRNDKRNARAILENYFDEDIVAAAERFASSDEFAEVIRYVPAGSRTVLDIGAGRGMASYAFAGKGFEVTALEPDPSNDVGAGAIRKLSGLCLHGITVVESFGETLPFDNNSFDVVYARQVLHHAADLPQFCREVARVLKPGGVFIATREHVISRQEDLQAFLDSHPLHHLYGGENAFTLDFYLRSIGNAAMEVTRVLTPLSSPINYAPVTAREIAANFAARLPGGPAVRFLLRLPGVMRLLATIKDRTDQRPGRLYSFIAQKPRRP